MAFLVKMDTIIEDLDEGWQHLCNLNEDQKFLFSLTLTVYKSCVILGGTRVSAMPDMKSVGDVTRFISFILIN